MTQNLTIFLITAILLVLIWIFWLRHRLILKREQILVVQNQFFELLQKRKDMLPYFLEAYREESPETDAWKALVKQRADLEVKNELVAHEAFEKEIFNFIKSAPDLKDVNFLEAKKDILDLTDKIHHVQIQFKEELQSYHQFQKRFPYNVVALCFRIKAA